MELCLEKNKLDFDKTLFVEENHENEKNLTAIYIIK